MELFADEWRGKERVEDRERYEVKYTDRQTYEKIKAAFSKAHHILVHI